MKTCGDCIHCDPCGLAPETLANGCEYFKYKRKFIELPCPIGETVYMITYGHDDWSGHDFKMVIQASFRPDMLKDFNKRFFLTREEAEKKLGEINDRM